MKGMEMVEWYRFCLFTGVLGETGLNGAAVGIGGGNK